MQKSALLFLVAGALGSAAYALDDTVSVKMGAQNGSGETGSATLLPQGKNTKVVIDLFNVPDGAVQPAHIHLGTCDNLDKAPKWKLEPVKNGRSVTVVPVSLETILKDRTAINVHKSAADIQTYVSCGDIVPTM